MTRTELVKLLSKMYTEEEIIDTCSERGVEILNFGIQFLLRDINYGLPLEWYDRQLDKLFFIISKHEENYPITDGDREVLSVTLGYLSVFLHKKYRHLQN